MHPGIKPVAMTKIEDWFSNGNDFEATLAKAIHEAEGNPKMLDFLADIKQAWDTRGMSAYMSRKVYLHLCKLAGVDECPCIS